jgi:hypothetical protein
MLTCFKFWLHTDPEIDETEKEYLTELKRWFKSCGVDFDDEPRGYEIIRFRKTFEKWTIITSGRNGMKGHGPEPQLIFRNQELFFVGEYETDQTALLNP